MTPTAGPLLPGRETAGRRLSPEEQSQQQVRPFGGRTAGLARLVAPGRVTATLDQRQERRHRLH